MQTKNTDTRASGAPEAQQKTQSDKIMEYIAAWDETPEGKAFRDAHDIRNPRAQHSPLPWYYVTGGAWTTPQGPDDGGQCVAMRGTQAQIDPCTKDANLRFIVRACNHAERLAEALRDCMADLDHYVSTHGPGPDHRRDAAREALAAWEGAQQ